MWANGGVRVAEGANGVGDNAEEGVMADGRLTVNGTCRAVGRFCSARRCPRPWPPEGQMGFT